MKKALYIGLLMVFVPCVHAVEVNWVDTMLGGAEEFSPELRILGGLSLLSLIPIVLIATTAFTRIIIVLAMLRHAIGLQQSPPNIVLITLALFLTLFTMSPVYQVVIDTAYTPYVENKIELSEAFDRASIPVKNFMLLQTDEKDFSMMVDVSGAAAPKNVSETSFIQLIPAFLLSELTTAFKIAFVIFLPFLAIDLIVASILMSLGMIMVPPITVALPLKIMLFVLIDGWSLLASSLIGSFGT
ncbi:flagellar type III secretion system pore protein FliP [Rheinheimera faecalis]|uniref:flagellar type III secretion system pore protein FliP n=1 Tax=Rheinheimera faecalis TaxID=2901141 RepID=UPI001E349CE7